MGPLQIPGVCCISLCLGIPAFLVSLTLSCVSSTQGICWVLPGFPLPEPWPVSWDNGWAHLTCFLSLEDHYPSLPDVQCLELPFHVFCSFLVSGRRVISVSYSILVGSGSPVFPFERCQKETQGVKACSGEYRGSPVRHYNKALQLFISVFFSIIALFLHFR